jgi:hypothetical protein
VGERHLTSVLRLAGEAIGVGWEFGFESLEALAWVAQTVESSVYVPHSLRRTGTGFRFALANPPLRVGAFSSVRMLVDGAAASPDRVRVRTVPVGPWRATSTIGAEQPLELQSGSGTEFDVDWPVPLGTRALTVRLELTNVAIPPLVWLEFQETLEEPSAP